MFHPKDLETSRPIILHGSRYFPRGLKNSFCQQRDCSPAALSAVCRSVQQPDFYSKYSRSDSSLASTCCLFASVSLIIVFHPDKIVQNESFSLKSLSVFQSFTTENVKKNIDILKYCYCTQNFWIRRSFRKYVHNVKLRTIKTIK